MFWWIKSYLHNRRARVVVDNTKSKKILTHEVPQGGALSPTPFILLINDLIKKFPSPVKYALYADDLAYGGQKNMQQLPKYDSKKQYTACQTGHKTVNINIFFYNTRYLINQIKPHENNAR